MLLQQLHRLPHGFHHVVLYDSCFELFTLQKEQLHQLKHTKSAWKIVNSFTPFSQSVPKFDVSSYRFK